jgi:hypothetical protein
MHRLPEIAHDHVSASASKPPPIKRQQNLTAGQSELDQNYSNSITPTEEPAFSTPSAIFDYMRRSKSRTYSTTSSALDLLRSP